MPTTNEEKNQQLSCNIGIQISRVNVMHTCDKLQKGIREIFLSFQGGFSKMYRIYRKILNSDEGDFEILVKSGMF